jgi:nucleoside-diphosphate kinase
MKAVEAPNEQRVIPFSERTLVLIKPDAVRRGLTGEIISRFERAGLTVIGLKLLRPTREHAEKHYPTTDAQLAQMGTKTLDTYAELGLDAEAQLGTKDARKIGSMVHGWNADFLSSGPVVAIVLEGVHAVKKVRALCGKTMPKDAAPGTIRGDFASASPAVANLQRSAVYNLVHASDNELDAEEPLKEIRHWFTEPELATYQLVDVEAMFAKD